MNEKYKQLLAAAGLTIASQSAVAQEIDLNKVLSASDIEVVEELGTDSLTTKGVFDSGCTNNGSCK